MSIYRPLLRQANRAAALPLLFALVWLCFSALPARALVLDWSNVTWTAGSLSGSFDLDGDTVNDVSVAITGNTGNFFSSSYPRVTEDFTGGLGSGTDQLDLYVDFSNTSQAITVTVTFLSTGTASGGATDVNFTLFDVDTGSVTGKGKNPARGFVDQIRNITAVATNNTLVGATLTVANSSYTQVGGSGTNQTLTGIDVAGDFSNQGSVGVSFGTNTISSFSFTYGQGPNSESDPFAQGIGLYDISFTPKSKIPEVHPGMISAALCLLIVAFRFRQFVVRPVPAATSARF